MDRMSECRKAQGSARVTVPVKELKTQGRACRTGKGTKRRTRQIATKSGECVRRTGKAQRTRHSKCMDFIESGCCRPQSREYHPLATARRNELYGQADGLLT